MADALNEAFLKLTSLTIRFGQLTFSLVIIGLMSQFLTGLCDRDLALPATHVAVTAISGVATAWSLVALLLTCCAGKIMLEIETTLDAVCVLMSIAQAAMLSQDALCSVRGFAQRYADAIHVGFLPDKDLLRASFGIAIVNTILFASTSLLSWAVFMIRRRQDRRYK
ncbi:hypothetical protein OQA88_8286 [Cercophora sp. LCS_1]